MRRASVAAVLIAVISLGCGATAWAAGNPNGTGQPSQSCQAEPASPGNASSARGSAFNEPSATSPGGVAGTHYAGSAPQNSNNPKSVAQYDVACYQVSK